MALITPGYVHEQKRLHASDAYGSRGFNWGFLVAGIAVIEKCKSILDYGCGKGTLGRALTDAGLDCRSYDPAIDHFAKPPAPADLVVSVDVLEHIEPELLDGVLDHIASLTTKRLFVAISTIKAKRFLSDGRNAHLLIEEAEFWRPRLEARGFQVRRVWDGGGKEWVAMLEKRP